VLSPTAFDELCAKAEILDSLQVLDASMEDMKAGRVRPFRDAVRDLAKDFGLKLDR
jgi:hypothetical protein